MLFHMKTMNRRFNVLSIVFRFIRIVKLGWFQEDVIVLTIPRYMFWDSRSYRDFVKKRSYEITLRLIASSGDELAGSYVVQRNLLSDSEWE